MRTHGRHKHWDAACVANERLVGGCAGANTTHGLVSVARAQLPAQVAANDALFLKHKSHSTPAPAACTSALSRCWVSLMLFTIALMAPAFPISVLCSAAGQGGGGTTASVASVIAGYTWCTKAPRTCAPDTEMSLSASKQATTTFGLRWCVDRANSRSSTNPASTISDALRGAASRSSQAQHPTRGQILRKPQHEAVCTTHSAWPAR